MYALQINDYPFFEKIINYEDLYNNYKNYLEYCIWSPRKILSLRKKQYFEEKQKHINYYTNIFKNNLLNNKKNICRSIVYLDDCCYNMNRLLSMDIIEQKQINEIYSNQYLSTNLKYVQYYQMKNFFPQDFKLINDYKIILELFDLLKSLFIKYTLTYDKSIKQNVNNYFMQLKKLEHECNRRVFKQIN